MLLTACGRKYETSIKLSTHIAKGFVCILYILPVQFYGSDIEFFISDGDISSEIIWWVCVPGSAH